MVIPTLLVDPQNSEFSPSDVPRESPGLRIQNRRVPIDIKKLVRLASFFRDPFYTLLYYPKLTPAAVLTSWASHFTVKKYYVTYTHRPPGISTLPAHASGSASSGSRPETFRHLRPQVLEKSCNSNFRTMTSEVYHHPVTKTSIHTIARVAQSLCLSNKHSLHQW